MLASLPRLELLFYASIVCYVLVRGCCEAVWLSVFEAGHFTRDSTAFSPGWTWTGRLKDGSDLEWAMTTRLMPETVAISVLHVSLSIGVVGLKLHPLVQQVVWLLFGVTVLVHKIGLQLTSLVVGQLAAVFALTASVQHTLLPWIASLLFLFYANNFVYAASTLSGDLALIESAQYFVFFQSMALQRTVAWCSEMVWQRHQRWKNGGRINRLFDFFTYSFYYPTMFLGPFVCPRQFVNQLILCDSSTSSDIDHRCCRIESWPRQLARCARLVLYFYLMELVLHFNYFYSWLADANKLSSVRLNYALGLSAHVFPGLCLQLKYTVIWGIPILVASFDGLHIANCPGCVARCVSCRQLWRNFDTGFYRFLVEYLYVPLGGSHFRLTSSLACVAFVVGWHSFSWNVLIWVSMNFFSSLIEDWFLAMLQARPVLSVKRKLSPVCQRRLAGLLMVFPYYVFSLSFLFFFSTGSSALHVFFERFFLRNLFVGLVSLFASFCLIQLSLEYSIRSKEVRFRGQ